jgi:TM2 domain-containing membrane protein YozV
MAISQDVCLLMLVFYTTLKAIIDKLFYFHGIITACGVQISTKPYAVAAPHRSV